MRQALHSPRFDPDPPPLHEHHHDLDLNVGLDGLRPDDERLPSAEYAYAVPLRVDRKQAPRYRLFNVGHERLVGVTVTLLGSGAMPSLPPQTLDVGAAVEVVIRGDDLARRTVLVVRWFRPSGDEYLWRVSF